MSGGREWTHPAFGEVAALCGARTGLTFFCKRPVETERKIRQAMDEVGLRKPAHYLARLHQDSRLLEALVERIVIGETFFFREQRVFEFLRTEVLPGLISQRSPEHCFRLWSAGCASGEEAYTLAIVLEEEGLSARSRVLGTDISRSALARAVRGVYSDWSLRGVDQVVRDRYFHHCDHRWAIRSRFRERTAFRFLNLASDSYPDLATRTTGMDIILCRNVLIYLDEETVQRVARNLCRSLSEGGWLFTGATDPPLSDYAPFETVVTDGGVFYRRGRLSTGRYLRLHDQAPVVPESQPSRLGTQASSVQVLEEAASRVRLRESRGKAKPAPVKTPPPPQAAPGTGEALAALERGDYPGVLAVLDEAGVKTLDATLLTIRALANLGRLAEAERCSTSALEAHPMCGELHFLHALILVERGCDEEARPALRKALYLAPDGALAHFSQGTMHVRRGRTREAASSFRTALKLASALPPEQPLDWSDGQSAGSLAQAAAAQLEMLKKMEASG